jgi:hypothetical protein
MRSQRGHALGLRSQREQAHPASHMPRHAQTDVTTTDNQQAFTPKPRGQGTKRGLV